MKLPAFTYHRPASVAEAVAILARYGEEGRPISGGQSLLPMMAMRLVTPAALVDLGGIAGLDRIELGARGTKLGAGVTWGRIERDRALAAAHPLLSRAVAHIAHYQIRNRGTVGGSLALADPAAEMPAVAVVCEGTIAVEGPSGPRAISASDFFLGPMTTALEENELVVALSLPPWPAQRRWAFREFAIRQGDFAVAGIALHFDLDEEGRIASPRLCSFGVGPGPVRLTAAEELLDGARPAADLFAAAAGAAAAMVEPQDDPRYPADYRRALVATLTGRALAEAGGQDR